MKQLNTQSQTLALVSKCLAIKCPHLHFFSHTVSFYWHRSTSCWTSAECWMASKKVTTSSSLKSKIWPDPGLTLVLSPPKWDLNSLPSVTWGLAPSFRSCRPGHDTQYVLCLKDKVGTSSAILIREAGRQPCHATLRIDLVGISKERVLINNTECYAHKLVVGLVNDFQ